jgi:pyruvate,orthophosphate dikinase
VKVRSILERHFKDMQDLEFTVEENRLYILQTRNGRAPATQLSESRSTWSMKD